jgi:hypothetical protein
MADVFISYASADRERARQLADLLTRRGYSVWWDRTIPPGRVFDEVIQEAIHGARCMIVLWSAAAVRSNWVKTEAAEGAARGMLVPALLDDVAPPIEFKRIQSANLTAWDGDEAHAEYRNLVEAVERLMRQTPATPSATPPAAASVPRAAPPYRAPAAGSHWQTIRTFLFGAMMTLVFVGGYWLFAKSGNAPNPPVAAKSVAPQASANNARSVDAGEVRTAAKTGAAPASRARVNLLSAEQGGVLLIASNERWAQVIDGKADTYAWADDGFGVFGFRDGRTALIDTLTVLVPAQAATNMRDFELFVGNQSPTGPFESIGRFSTQNMRMMDNPYQAFRFAPVKAKYFKLQSLRNHDNSTAASVHEIQLFGELQ